MYNSLKKACGGQGGHNSIGKIGGALKGAATALFAGKVGNKLTLTAAYVAHVNLRAGWWQAQRELTRWVAAMVLFVAVHLHQLLGRWRLKQHTRVRAAEF